MYLFIYSAVTNCLYIIPFVLTLPFTLQPVFRRVNIRLVNALAPCPYTLIPYDRRDKSNHNTFFLSYQIFYIFC
jgi:hypothetical protein